MRRLFQWLVPNTAPLIERLRDDGPVAGVAASVVHSSQLSGVLETAAAAKREAILLGEAWRMQLDREHPKRQAMRRAGLEWSANELRPGLDAISDDVIDEISERHYQAQVLGDPSALTAPGHIYAGPCGDGRSLDLAIAHRFSEIARGTGAAEAEGQEGRRAILVEVIADARYLTSTVIRELVAAYAEVECDAYWLTAWGFTGSAAQYGLLRELAKRLEIETGRPCIAHGLHQLWPAAIANGIAGASVGWGSGVAMPEPVAEDEDQGADDEEDDHGIGIALNFVEVLGGVANGPRGEEARLALLRLARCGCGNHSGAREPGPQIDYHGHNLFVAEQLATMVSSRNPAQATAALWRQAQAAQALRDQLGMGRLDSAWQVAGETGSWGLINPRVPRQDLFWRAASAI